MAKPPSSDPSVTTFSDHEVIRPPNALRGAVLDYGEGVVGDDDPVSRAEAALADLSSEFSVWMAAECERLDGVRRQVEKHGLNPATREELFRAAHDIRGEAATFGYPLAAQAAESLCRLLDHASDVTRIPFALVDQHVDGVRAIIREDGRCGGAIAAALAQSLRDAVDAFLTRAGGERADAAIKSPPLVPNG